MLFFFPENPFSKKGGNIIRAYSNLRIFKKLNIDVDLVGCEGFYKDSGEGFGLDYNYIKNFHLVGRKPTKNLLSLIYWKYKIIKLFSKENKSNFFLTAYFKDCFNKILAENSYDYIVISYEFWTDLIRNVNLKGATKIVDTHDWITLNEYYKNPKLDIGKKFNEEIQNLNFYDKVVTISRDEFQVFSNFLGDKVVNIPQGFPSHYEGNPKTFSEKKFDLIFVGSNNPFNVQAVKWFFEMVYPLLPKNLNLCFIGKICEYFKEEPNVHLIPFAENLDDYYYDSKIAICPMLEGTGIKIKVVEALSYGLPVVGTVKAVDGFNSKIQNGCMISNDASEFAENIVKLLSTESLYQSIVQEGITFFDNHFTEKEVENDWKNILN